MGEELPGPHPHAKFNQYHFQNVGLQPQKSPKLVIPLKRFLLNLTWIGIPGSASSYQISPFWLLKCGPTASNIAKNRNVWYKFAPK